MHCEAVTFYLKDLEVKSDLPEGDSQWVNNAAPLCRALHIPSIPNFDSMVSKNGAIDLRPTNPFGGFWGEWDAA